MTRCENGLEKNTDKCLQTCNGGKQNKMFTVIYMLLLIPVFVVVITLSLLIWLFLLVVKLLDRCD